MKRIGIVAKPQDPLAAQVLNELLAWLAEKGLETVMDRDTAEIVGRESNILRAHLPPQSDLIIVLGGDGTLISIARLVEDNKTPILGVNLGSLGFLTEIAMEDLYPILDNVLNGEFTVEERIMLDTVIIREGKEVGNYSALNDIVINRGALARIVEMEVHVNDLYVATYRADGLIVSTPTGSTGYSLAADGPILYPTLEALVIAPICPQSLSNRPVIIPDQGEITVNLKTKDEEVMATIDGQIGFALTYRDIVKIRKSNSVTVLILSPKKNYYQILREKLKWGERIGKPAP